MRRVCLRAWCCLLLYCIWNCPRATVNHSIGTHSLSMCISNQLNSCTFNVNRDISGRDTESENERERNRKKTSHRINKIIQKSIAISVIHAMAWHGIAWYELKSTYIEWRTTFIPPAHSSVNN